MIIPEDGCLPKITRSGFAAFNNVMIIKVPEKFRKPGETSYQLATLDTTKKGERWPADKYLDGSNPVSETDGNEPKVTQKNVNEKSQIGSSLDTGRLLHPNHHTSELQDSSKTYNEREPIPVWLPKATPTTSKNTHSSLPLYNPPHNFELSDSHSNGLIGNLPFQETHYGKREFFNKSTAENAFNARRPIRGNFYKGKNARNQNKFPNSSSKEEAFSGFSKNQFPTNFSHQKKYNNSWQDGALSKDRFEKRINTTCETAPGNETFNNLTTPGDVSRNNLMETHHINPHNYPLRPPDINPTDGLESRHTNPHNYPMRPPDINPSDGLESHHLNPHNYPMRPPNLNPHNYPMRPPNINPTDGLRPLMPAFHCVRPFNYFNKATVPPVSGPPRDLPNTDLARVPIRNVRDNIPFTGVSNGAYGSESFPLTGFSGIPSHLEGNFNRINDVNIDSNKPINYSQANDSFGVDYNNMNVNHPTTDYFRRDPQRLSRWNRFCGPRNGDEAIHRKGFMQRNQKQPWRNSNPNNGPNMGNNNYYNRGRRNYRYQNNRHSMNEHEKP